MTIPFEKRPVVALDIGNVCIQLHQEEFKLLRGVPLDMPAPPAFRKVFRDLETGQISEEEWLDAFYELTERKIPRAKLMKIWLDIIGDNIPGMPEAVTSLADRFRFCYLSDTSRLHMDMVVRKNKFAHLVTGGVFSYEAHCFKPEAGMFELFEARYGVPCAYFDDVPKNVEGARARGWNGHVFESAEQFLAVMNEIAKEKGL